MHRRDNRRAAVTFGTDPEGQLGEAVFIGLRLAGGRAAVTVDGVLDGSTVHLLTDALDSQLALGRRHVRVDLTRATISDIGVLRHLVPVHERFLLEHGLLVCDPAPAELVARIRAAHLDQILFIAAHSDRAGAEPHSDAAPADDPLTSQRRARRTSTGTARSRVAVTKDQP